MVSAKGHSNESGVQGVFSLGQRIREVRLSKKVTQVDLARNICTPSMISQIESDRARPSYKILYRIADRLEVPLEKLLSGLDINSEYIANYKMARALVSAKEYTTAIAMLQELLHKPCAQISKIDILFELGECYLQMDQLYEAEQTLEEIQEFATLRRDHHLLASIYNKHASIELRRKNYQLAAFKWMKALEEVEQMPEVDVSLKATILNHLGAVSKALGSTNESIAYFDKANQLFMALE